MEIEMKFMMKIMQSRFFRLSCSFIRSPMSVLHCLQTQNT